MTFSRAFANRRSALPLAATAIGGVFALTLALSGGGAARAEPGAWEVTATASSLDGQRSYTALLKSDEEVANVIGREEHATLAFSCGKNGFFATLDWPDFIDETPEDYNIAFRWKLDDGPVQKSRWFGGQTSLTAMGNKGMSWLKTISGGKTLVVQVPDRHGGQEVTFQIAGVADIYAQLAARSCP
jgi:hypothetical protein